MAARHRHYAHALRSLPATPRQSTLETLSNYRVPRQERVRKSLEGHIVRLRLKRLDSLIVCSEKFLASIPKNLQ